MTCNEFINWCIEQQPVNIRAKITAYITYARKSGARICNDGFPDTRFKGTYSADHEKVRRYIGACRDHYRMQYPHPMHVINKQRKEKGCTCHTHS